jgi:hypothetical protein
MSNCHCTFQPRRCCREQYGEPYFAIRARVPVLSAVFLER